MLKFSMVCILQDKDKLMTLLTFTTVEEAIKKRVEMKAKTYGQEMVVYGEGEGDDEGDPVYKITPSLVADLYGDWIMPLTKKVQVEYLLRRLDWRVSLQKLLVNIVEICIFIFHFSLVDNLSWCLLYMFVVHVYTNKVLLLLLK